MGTGYNDFGQLGTGNTTSVPNFKHITQFDDVATVVKPLVQSAEILSKPVYNQTVYTAVYDKLNNVTTKSEPAEGGTVEVSKNSGIAENEEIEITAVHEIGYKLNSLKVTVDGETPTEITVTDNKFLMPNGDVTVTAQFIKKW